ncbi:MAG: FapA family protein [Phycisphaeraceae bacterium]
MADGRSNASIQVELADDKSVARLIVPPGLPRDFVTEQLCRTVLREAGVAWDAAVAKQVAKMLDALPPEGEKGDFVVARSVPVRHGEDAVIEWLVDETEVDREELSHYDRSAYVLVESGQTIARITPPTHGEDGRDVTGKPLIAQPGRDVELKLDETVMRSSQGELVAQIEGVLVRSGEEVRISPQLEVPDYVDFSTGNIDFDGDVVVGKGIRDCFLVAATGNVEVSGLIEAATIRCGGDLMARGGMAGRERGEVHVGGSLHARYLDNLEGDVGGDLVVEREAINAWLGVSGEAQVARGSIIGGKLTVAKRIEAASLGSAAGVTTRLVLGRLPKLEKQLAELKSIITRLKQRLEKLEEEQLRLKQAGRLGPEQAERQTELSFEMQQAQGNLAKARGAHATLHQRIETRRCVDLNVTRTLHPGVVLIFDDHAYLFSDPLSGPVRIERGEDGELVYRQGSSSGPRPLAQITSVRAADEALRRDGSEQTCE